jgi:hypothetical protein
MSESLRLVVPVDERFRGLAPEVVRKFVEIAGGGAHEADAVEAALRGRLEELAAAADEVSLELRTGAGAVEIAVRCGDRSALITQPLPARR